MLTSCIVVGLIVASATETTIYHVNTDMSAIQHRDFESEIANIAFRDRSEVQVVRDLPGLPPKSRISRCGITELATLSEGEF